MDPEFAAALQAAASDVPLLSGPPTIEQIRDGFNHAVRDSSNAYHLERLPPASAYTVEDKVIDRDGAEIVARCIVPVTENEQETFPLFFSIHGGGGCVGSIELDDPILRRLSVDLRVVIVNVEYRLAPEHPFPTGINDCYAALKWVVSNASSLKADLTKGFVIGGHSAGANFSAVLAHEARDDPFFKDAPITGQLLREPRVVAPDVLPESFRQDYRAYEENASVPPLTRPMIKGLNKMYAAPLADPRFAPLLYPSHAGLPPAYIHAMGMDSLRDDAIIYERALREAGVKTQIKVFPGLGHGVHYNWPNMKISGTIMEDARGGLEWLLGREA